jgi:diaminopimelate epimerase
MQFVKVHGSGNDFVLLPDLADRFSLTAGLVRALCTPHLGLGADGVIRLGAPRPGQDADAFMDYRNADGSTAEMCGNGVRCVAKYLIDRGLIQGDEVRIDTLSGVKRVRCQRGRDGRMVRGALELGEPVPLKVDLVLDVAGTGTVHVTTLSLGNPHAVLVTDDLAAAQVASLGPALQRDEEFPDGTNVEFLQVRDRASVAGRIWERGVGETLASSSGAAALAVAANLLDLADRHVTVAMPGGDLDVDWGEDGVTIAGPAVEVAAGELDQAWLASVGAA